MIPLSTTTIRILRPSADPERDPYDAEVAPSEIATGIRAHISAGSGTENVAGGSQEVLGPRLSCDIVDLNHLDRIEDQVTGHVYEVVDVLPRIGFGLDHMEAGLKRVSGPISLGAR